MTRARGFTLIEILLAMFVLALVAGLAAMAMDHSGERRARYQVKSLSELLNALVDEAESTGQTYGVVIEDHAYRVVVLDPVSKSWGAPSDQKLSKKVVLEDNRELSFTEGESVGWWEPRKLPVKTDTKDNAPQILILASGEMSAFRLSYTGGEGMAHYVIESDGVAPVRWEQSE